MLNPARGHAPLTATVHLKVKYLAIRQLSVEEGAPRGCRHCMQRTGRVPVPVSSCRRPRLGSRRRRGPDSIHPHLFPFLQHTTAHTVRQIPIQLVSNLSVSRAGLLTMPS